VNVVNTSANPVVTAMPTHLGVPARSLLTLVCETRAISPGGACQQQNTDSTITAFTGIPAGHEYVITDVSWLLFGLGSGTIDYLYICGPTSNCPSPTFEGWSTTFDFNGLSYGTRHYTTGITLTVQPSILTGAPLFPPSTVTLRGYLAPTGP
jgi:hypothetical protein